MPEAVTFYRSENEGARRLSRALLISDRVRTALTYRAKELDRERRRGTQIVEISVAKDLKWMTDRSHDPVFQGLSESAKTAINEITRLLFLPSRSLKINQEIFVHSGALELSTYFGPKPDGHYRKTEVYRVEEFLTKLRAELEECVSEGFESTIDVLMAIKFFEAVIKKADVELRNPLTIDQEIPYLIFALLDPDIDDIYDRDEIYANLKLLREQSPQLFKPELKTVNSSSHPGK